MSPFVDWLRRLRLYPRKKDAWRAKGPDWVEEPIPARLKVEISHQQVEIKLVYLVDPRRDRQRYKMELYIFMPAELESVHTHWYTSLWDVIRLHTPEVPLSRLSDVEGRLRGVSDCIAILTRLSGTLARRDKKAKREAVRRGLELMRLQACIFRSSLRAASLSLREALKAAVPRTPPCAGVLPLQHLSHSVSRLVQHTCLAIEAMELACGKGKEAAHCKATHAAPLREGWYLIDEYVLLETERTFLKLLRQVVHCQRRFLRRQATSGRKDRDISPVDTTPSYGPAAEAEGPIQATSFRDDRSAPQPGGASALEPAVEVEGPIQATSFRNDRSVLHSDDSPALAPAAALVAQAEVVEHDQATQSRHEQTGPAPSQATPSGRGARSTEPHQATRGQSSIELHRVSPSDRRQSGMEPNQAMPSGSTKPNEEMPPGREQSSRESNQAIAPRPLLPHQARAKAKRVELPLPVGMGAELDEPDFARYSKCERTFHSGLPGTPPSSWDGPPPRAEPRGTAGQFPYLEHMLTLAQEAVDLSLVGSPGVPAAVGGQDRGGPLGTDPGGCRETAHEQSVSPEALALEPARRLLYEASRELEGARDARGYDESILRPHDPLCNEAYTHRVRALKRNARLAISLVPRARPPSQVLFDLVGMLVAGLAMGFAVFTVWLAQQYSNNKQWAPLYIMIVVVGYIAKDRIKEWGKRYLVPTARFFGASFPDRVIQIVDQHGRRMGRCLEEVTTLDAGAVTEKVLRLRNSTSRLPQGLRDALKPERVVCYKKRVDVHWHRLDPHLRSSRGLSDIMRLDFSPYSRRQKKVTWHWESRAGLEPSSAAMSTTSTLSSA